MNPEQPEQQITSKNYFIASVWGAAVIYLTKELSGLGVLLIKLPVLGVPWLYWHLTNPHDRTKDLSTAFFTLLMGAMMTLFCVVPWVIVYSLLK